MGRIIMAFASLVKKIPHHLVIAGVAFKKSARELSLIQKHHLNDRVVLTGFVEQEDLPALYSMADLFVFPSLYEGFGIPLLEATACGCPIVTSRAGSCPEVVDDAALLVEPTDTSGIADAIYRVLSNRRLTEQLIAKGLNRV
ncbi:MAG: glycosyltransferase family 4 protein [Gammaproteobacteria bacterium]